MSRVGGVTEWIDSTLRGGAGNDDSERTREKSTKNNDVLSIKTPVFEVLKQRIKQDAIENM